MSGSSQWQILLGDPLNEVTRQERKTLLGIAIVGVAIAKTGLVPAKISALGIEFNETDQRSLLIVIAAVILYFLIAFVVYASTDFLKWRIAYYEAHREHLRERIHRDEDELNRHFEVEEELHRRLPREYMFFLFSRPASLARALFEFGVPVAVGIYSVIVVWTAKIP